MTDIFHGLMKEDDFYYYYFHKEAVLNILKLNCDSKSTEPLVDMFINQYYRYGKDGNGLKNVRAIYFFLSFQREHTFHYISESVKKQWNLTDDEWKQTRDSDIKLKREEYYFELVDTKTDEPIFSIRRGITKLFNPMLKIKNTQFERNVFTQIVRQSVKPERFVAKEKEIHVEGKLTCFLKRVFLFDKEQTKTFDGECVLDDTMIFPDGKGELKIYYDNNDIDVFNGVMDDWNLHKGTLVRTKEKQKVTYTNCWFEFINGVIYIKEGTRGVVHVKELDALSFIDYSLDMGTFGTHDHIQKGESFSQYKNGDTSFYKGVFGADANTVINLKQGKHEIYFKDINTTYIFKGNFKKCLLHQGTYTILKNDIEVKKMYVKGGKTDKVIFDVFDKISLRRKNFLQKIKKKKKQETEKERQEHEEKIRKEEEERKKIRRNVERFEKQCRQALTIFTKKIDDDGQLKRNFDCGRYVFCLEIEKERNIYLLERLSNGIIYIQRPYETLKELIAGYFFWGGDIKPIKEFGKLPTLKQQREEKRELKR